MNKICEKNCGNISGKNYASTLRRWKSFELVMVVSTRRRARWDGSWRRRRGRWGRCGPSWRGWWATTTVWAGRRARWSSRRVWWRYVPPPPPPPNSLCQTVIVIVSSSLSSSVTSFPHLLNVLTLLSLSHPILPLVIVHHPRHPFSASLTPPSHHFLPPLTPSHPILRLLTFSPPRNRSHSLGTRFISPHLKIPITTPIPIPMPIPIPAEYDATDTDFNAGRRKSY